MENFQLPSYNIEEKRSLIKELQSELSDPSLVKDQEKFAEKSIQYNETKEIISTWNQLEEAVNQYHQAVELSEDPDMQEMAQTELDTLSKTIPKLQKEFRALTIPKLPDDTKPAILEIRAGTGGTEASLFAEEILRMYMRYLNDIKLPGTDTSVSYQKEGGIKEASVEVNHLGAFGKLRFEGGVHRVQRVPSTESGGRIHTSAVSVAVLPLIETKDVDIKDQDLNIESFRSSGPGGQSVNTTDSAVRITHKPSGITVSCQDGKSQHKNKEKAMKILASKLYEIQQKEAEEAAQKMRGEAVKSGDRSVKIRTYNFPQGRVTDHRTKDTWYDLHNILEGNLEDVVPVINRKLRGIDQ